MKAKRAQEMPIWPQALRQWRFPRSSNSTAGTIPSPPQNRHRKSYSPKSPCTLSSQLTFPQCGHGKKVRFAVRITCTSGREFWKSESCLRRAGICLPAVRFDKPNNLFLNVYAVLTYVRRGCNNSRGSALIHVQHSHFCRWTTAPRTHLLGAAL